MARRFQRRIFLAVTCPRLVSQCLCESGVVVVPIQRELVGSSVAQRGMRTLLVVLLPVILGHSLCVEQGGELLDVQQFVAEFAIERFNERALPRESWVDERDAGGAAPAPVRDRLLEVISAPLSMRTNTGLQWMLVSRSRTQTM